MKRIREILPGMFCALSVAIVQADQEEWPEIEFTECRAFVSSEHYDQLLDTVASGDGAAIDLAVRLRCCVDAASALGLYFSLAEALVTAPERVAPYLDTLIPANRICRVPYIEEPPEKGERFLRDALAALSTLERRSEGVERCKALLHRKLGIKP